MKTKQNKRKQSGAGDIAQGRGLALQAGGPGFEFQCYKKEKKKKEKAPVNTIAPLEHHYTYINS
jgi:hypothetical protein